ncbi:winged helix-turn-helix domain-containing protein [Spirosoma endbachense]|uniref:winged helix-turn-helix domain-containing protein n=1 Tax=Spirosoma endbachense TaxID=2666025 RepID=UPI001E456456|nr:winged helix-turn-helix domain-containing protein [Spirosoma endbachense]
MANYKPSDYELLRRRCAQLKEQGWKQTKIAQALGLTEGWVSRTLKKYRQEGQAALTWRKPSGPACRLTDQQLTQLIEELNKGAEQHGFPGHIWTRPRVNELIKKLFGVSYDVSQVGRLLKKLEWTRQKPQPKARQQNPQRVQQWRDERLPELKKSQG